MGLKPRKGIGGRPRTSENALSEWIDKNLASGEDSSTPRERFARLVDVTLAYVNDLCRGRKTPGAGLALRIEEVTNGEVGLKDMLS